MLARAVRLVAGFGWCFRYPAIPGGFRGYCGSGARGADVLETFARGVRPLWRECWQISGRVLVRAR